MISIESSAHSSLAAWSLCSAVGAGGISTGKSAVCSYLTSTSAPHQFALIDFDKIAREVVEPGHRSGGLDRVVAEFGRGVLRDDGTLDRAKLGGMIFGDASARARLSRVMKVPIWSTFFRRALAMFFLEGHREIILDVPLLFESKLSMLCSETMVIYAGADTQRTRLMARDSISSEAAQTKMDAQWPLDRKVALADTVIENDGTLPQLHQALDAWVRTHQAQQARGGLRGELAKWTPTVPTLLIVAACAPILLSITALSRWILF